MQPRNRMLVVRPNWLRPSEKTEQEISGLPFLPYMCSWFSPETLCTLDSHSTTGPIPTPSTHMGAPIVCNSPTQGIWFPLSLEPGMCMVHRHTCRPNIHAHEIKFKREKSKETLEGDTVSLLYCFLLCLTVLNTAHSSCFLGRRAMHKGEQELSFQNNGSSLQVSVLSTCWSWRNKQ